MNTSFNFDLVAGQYDSYYKSDFGKEIDRIEKSIIRNYLNEITVKSLVELGCGTGHWTEFFSDLGFSIKAIDISKEMLAFAMAKNIKNADFQLGDMQNIDFPDESVENIIAITSIEFVVNREKVIREIYRVLKPGGYFICAGLNDYSPFWNDKKEDTVYKNANFLNVDDLKQMMAKFGNPKITAGVVFENNTFCDDKYTENEKLNLGAFIAAGVKKQL